MQATKLQGIAHWSFDFSPECTYSMVFEVTEHSGELNIWFRICGNANCKGYGYCFKYKLRMFRIPIDGPADVFCDNQAVVKNTSLPESVLSKKHNAINYHAVQEAVAAEIMRVVKEDGETNLADLLTKSLNLPKRKRLLGCMTY